MKESTKIIAARELALKVLAEVWQKGAYANLALNRELNKVSLPDIERHFATELVYGSVKAGEVLDLILKKFVTRPLQKIAPRILNILRLGIFQIFFLERIPDSAAVNEAVKQARKFGHEGTVKFVNGILRSAVRFKESGGLLKDKELAEEIALQHPKWLRDLWKEQLWGQESKDLCEFDNLPAPLCLRTNTLKITREELEKILTEEKLAVKKSCWAPEGLVCQNNPALPTLASFQAGLYQVQDESSMLVAHYLDVKAGQTILDLCAAPGGKTTHLAALMQNQGRLLATDIHQHKLALIEENAVRLGVKNIETQLQDATVFKKQWEKLADRVLVDAPCSGLGVLRRRPDLRWRKQPEDLLKLPRLQIKILQNAANYLKAGGKLVYSTCTTTYAENMGVIEAFLAANKDFALEKIKHPILAKELDYLQLWPHLDKTDGFFICVLKRQ